MDKSTSSSASAEPAFGGMSLNAAQWQRHESRMRRVIAHVHAHLDQPLDLNALSDIACMSPHH